MCYSVTMSISFEELGIESKITEPLKALNISEPTKVQEKVIPLIMEGKNLLFQSETGTGKTFAYLLPLMQKFTSDNRKVRIIIASPTYELASQIKSQLKNICEVKSALMIGGAPLNRQLELLKEKPEVIIGGPSRILELIHLKKLKVDAVNALVLDETDRLLSKELRDETEALIDILPDRVQLIGNSATVNSYTQKVLQNARLKYSQEENQEYIKQTQMELVLLPPEDVLRKRITHQALFSERRDKIDTLRSYINAVKPEKMIVFTSRADQIQNITSKLKYKKIECEGLSAKTDKKERKAIIDRFKSGKIKILITTDLVSRGLDINNITHVVQMDFKENEDFFIHRAGRTARAGKTGINMVIGDQWELEKYAALEKKLKLTVYPKILYKGQVISPEQSEENS